MTVSAALKALIAEVAVLRRFKSSSASGSPLVRSTTCLPGRALALPSDQSPSNCPAFSRSSISGGRNMKMLTISGISAGADPRTQSRPAAIVLPLAQADDQLLCANSPTAKA